MSNVESGMEMNVPDSVVAQILAQAPNAQVAEAMLLGSSFEGGWGPTFAVGDQGTSFGPFQMHQGGALTSSGLTPQQAQDPAEAVRAMLASYEQATAAQGALWQTYPELAAEQAAAGAERPAESYLANYGQKTLDTHWAQVLAALKQPTGSTAPGAGPTSGPGTPDTSSSSAADTQAVLLKKSSNPLGYLGALNPILGLATGGLDLTGGGGLGSIATNIGVMAKNIVNFTGAILYGGTWIRFGEALLGFVALSAGVGLLVVILASSQGGLSTIGTVAALIPGEGQAARAGASIAAGARSAGGRQPTALRAFTGAQSHARARGAGEARERENTRRAGERHHAATYVRSQKAYQRSVNVYTKARERDRKAAQDEADEREYRDTNAPAARRNNKKIARNFMDTSDIKKRTA